jgi:hypothetical protein
MITMEPQKPRKAKILEKTKEPRIVWVHMYYVDDGFYPCALVEDVETLKVFTVIATSIQYLEGLE